MKPIRINKVKECREKAGLSKAKLSKLSDVSIPTISAIENHKREGSPPTYHRILYGLNLSDCSNNKFIFEDVFPISKKK